MIEFTRWLRRAKNLCEPRARDGHGLRQAILQFLLLFFPPPLPSTPRVLRDSPIWPHLSPEICAFHGCSLLPFGARCHYFVSERSGVLKGARRVLSSTPPVNSIRVPRRITVDGNYLSRRDVVLRRGDKHPPSAVNKRQRRLARPGRWINPGARVVAVRVTFYDY